MSKQQATLEKALIIYQITERAPPVLTQLNDVVRRIPGVELKKIEDLNDFDSIFTPENHGILILCVSNKDELRKILYFTNKHQLLISEGYLGLMVFNSMIHPHVPRLLKEQGCTEILNYSINTRACSTFIQEILDPIEIKAAKRQSQKLRKQKARGEIHSSPLSSETENRLRQKIIYEVKRTPPLTLRSDFWIYHSKSNAKCIMGRWLIELLGPAPSAGAWKSNTTHDLSLSSQQATWEWVPRNPNSENWVTEKGRWFFWGRQPEYIWKTHHWRFVGHAPALAFCFEDGHTVYRFQFIEPATLELCENSEASLQHHEKIKKTFETSLQIQNDAPPAEENSEPLILETSSGQISTTASEDLQTEDLQALRKEKEKRLKELKALKEQKLKELNQKSKSRKIPYTLEYDKTSSKQLPQFQTGSRAFETIKMGLHLLEPDDLLPPGETEIEILEINSSEMLLSLADVPIDPYLSYLFRFQSSGAAPKINFAFPATVIDSCSVDEGRMQLLISIPPEIQPLFSDVLDSLEKRQSEIAIFLKIAKGLEDIE